MTRPLQDDAAPLVSVKNLSVRYDAVRAVDNVSFEVRAGGYLCIVGENGSGKSTVLNAILGLVAPDAGSVSLNGLRRDQVGFIPQQTSVQKDFPACVFEMVLSGCANRRALPFYTRRDRQRARDNLARMGMGAHGRRSYHELSGGQRQRVLLARALCSTDALLLLDEPAAGLDPAMANELHAILETLNRQGLTIVMVSHDIAGAAKRAGTILHLRNATVFCGTAAEYLESPIYKHLAEGCPCLT
jgi:zinc transport system ATP-binding protein